MNQGTILGSHIGRWILLAALAVALGALLLTIRPVVAQTEGCSDTGLGPDRKGICNFSHAENDTSQVGRLTTREYDQRQVVKVWELVRDDTDFPDYDDFRIDRKSGVLTFKVTPDYEKPRSSVTSGNLAAKNVYKVKAKLGDGEKFVYTEVTVRVTGEEEAETLTLSARQPEVGTTLTATLDGGDILGLRTPDWQWQVEDGSGGWTDIEDAVNHSYTPKEGDAGKKLRAYVSYQDSHGTDTTMLGDPLLIGTGVTEFAVRAKPSSNVAPMFRDADEDTTTNGVQDSRRIEENSPPGMKVGPPVFATDDNHLAWDDANDPGGPRDVLTYSLAEASTTADDGLFSIDQKTGQIMTKEELDFEGSLTDRDTGTDGLQLTVTAIATDPSGATGMVTVTIHVLDVDEVPEVTGPAALTYFENQPTTLAAPLLLYKDPTRTSDADPTPLDILEANQATYMAIDNDLAESGITLAASDIEWELRGKDASKFMFVGATGTYTDSTGVATGTPLAAPSPALQWREAPDLEDPMDEGGTPGDNVYEITVRAWDEDWLIGEREVSIRVADSNDTGTVTLSHIQAQAGTPITATLKDQDDISTTVTWTWTLGGTTVTSGVKSSGNTSTYTPADDATGTLGVTAMYTDGGGTTETATYPPATVTAVEVRANPVTTVDDPATDDDERGLNTAPKFYSDEAVSSDTTTGGNDPAVLDASERTLENETTTYTRYVLENQTRNVRNSEADARGYDPASATFTADNTAAALKFFDGHFTTGANRRATPPVVADDTAALHFGLSGADAKYFSISNAAADRGLISTKGPLDFETKSTYTVTVTATDPAGLTDKVTVTINALDVPEIEGLEGRYRVNENEKFIDDPEVAYPPDVSLGGLKWSLLNYDADAATTPHNRDSLASIDCVADPTNIPVGNPEGLCDNFLVRPQNGAQTNLRFAIGTGEKHDAPDFEKPADKAITGTEETDNVYKIVVRVAFANLRSQQSDNANAANHPHPADDEKQDFEVWIRVDDVDEAPKFTDDATTRLIAENTDDLLPAVAINRSVVGTVAASDPEYRYEDGPQYNKKLVYSLNAGDYSNLFQIVPSTGEILTRSRLNYEALTELTEMGPSGGQHRIITVPTVTATDAAEQTAKIMGNSDMDNSDDIGAHIRVNDVNETPIPLTMSVQTGTTEVSQYPENREDTTVGTYVVSGGNTDTMGTVEWSLEGADADDFSIDGGVVDFDGTPDYENPTDRDEDPNTAGDQGKGDNAYQVTVKATLGNQEVTRDVTVTVTNVDELGTITSPTIPAEYAENGTDDLGTFTIDGAGADSVMWSLEGADEGMFDITGGSLTFKDAPDYEAMADADGDNTYMVTVKAEAGGEVETEQVTVMVTDVNELGDLAGDMTPSHAENSTDAVATYTLSGGTMDDAAMWSLEGADEGMFDITGGSLTFKNAPDYENPMGGADGDSNTYMVTVMAEAGGEMETRDVTITVTDVNELGTLTGDAAVDYPENGTGAVDTYTLSGGSMDSVATWSLGGDDAGDFDITGGSLTFKNAPDYENPMGGADGDSNAYMVTVMAEAGGEMETRDVTITVTDVNELGDLAGDMTPSHAENSTDAVATYTLSGGTMDDAAMWSLEGADEGMFDITGGSLTFKNAPDYETPMGGANGDSNTYMVTVMAAAGGEMEEMDVTVMVDDVNELGMLAGDASHTYAENGTAAVATYTLSGGTMDDDAEWMLEGDDAGAFNIDAGALTFMDSPDYENPADANTDNTYMVTVKAMAGGEMVMMDATVTVTNVNEAPVITGHAEVLYVENGTGNVATYTATDPEGADIDWTLSGADMGAFAINGGTLTFMATPDYENPADADGNNEYMVKVMAADGFSSATHDVMVMVTNMDEDGMVTLSPAIPVVGAEVTASLTDPDGGVTGISWQWASADTEGGPFSNISDATSASYTVAAGAVGKYLQATATYTDGHGPGKEAASAAVMISDNVVDRYNTNGMPGIQIGELFTAIDDYFAGNLTIDELLEIIDAYFA